MFDLHVHDLCDRNRAIYVLYPGIFIPYNFDSHIYVCLFIPTCFQLPLTIIVNAKHSRLECGGMECGGEERRWRGGGGMEGYLMHRCYSLVFSVTQKHV